MYECKGPKYPTFEEKEGHMRGSIRAIGVALVALSFVASNVVFAAANKGLVIEGDPATVGNANAPQGGTINMVMSSEPATLNPITATDVYASIIRGYTIDSLMDMNPDTYEFVPGLAEKAEQSPDGKTFTFYLRKGVKFHDGKPLTAEDVKFSFEAMFDPKYNAMHMRPYFENFEPTAEVLDPHTIRFRVKEKYFRNFDTIAGMLRIVPKHVYGDPESGKKKNKTIIGSGPYKLEKYDQGQSIVLVKNPDWWGKDLKWNKGRYNFERIRFRFIKDENIALEALKKGEVDFFDDLTAEGYMKKAVGPEWGKTVFKVKTENLSPKSYGFIGWNLRRELFQDKNVRHALQLLMNREEMNKKFRFNMDTPASGPWYSQSEYADPNVKPVPYDPKKAVELLKKAGWEDTNKDGVLDKDFNGQRRDFRFTLYYANKDSEKYWVMYQSDLKKVGIDMKLQVLEWNTFLKNLDDGNFDAAALGWSGGSVDVDPKQIWHSSTAVKGGSNFIGYKNPEVDKLIDQARQELDKKKRITILRKVYRMIAEDYPYAFLFVATPVLYAHTDKVKYEKPTFKYGVGTDYWWLATAGN